ncbi:MAG: hypothetical protein ABIK15_09350 [Pseudomonadota bacterium]
MKSIAGILFFAKLRNTAPERKMQVHFKQCRMILIALTGDATSLCGCHRRLCRPVRCKRKFIIFHIVTEQTIGFFRKKYFEYSMA